jgi:hypothetical protein
VSYSGAPRSETKSPFGSVHDPYQYQFYVVTAAGGPISAGQEVSLRVAQTHVNWGPYWFRISGPSDGAVILGDGTTPFLDDTVFIAEFTEVKSNLGFRPPEVICQVCASVTGTVVGRGGASVAGAAVTSQGAAVS